MNESAKNMFDTATIVALCIMHNERKTAEDDTRPDGVDANRVGGATQDHVKQRGSNGAGCHGHYAADGASHFVCGAGGRS